MLSVATWNVNSVRSRLQHLVEWLRADKPDIVLLQELKCMDEQFPRMEIEELGYNIALHGQKTYNGVAVLSLYPIDEVIRGLPGDDSDVHARYIEAVISLPGKAIRVVSVYVPNGQTADSDKFSYKLAFLDRLRAHCQQLVTYDEVLIIGGDYNIAPTDADVHNPAAWRGSVLTHDEVRNRWRKIMNVGLFDAALLTQSCAYSWWDYRAGAFDNDNGLRIDHLLLSAQAADLLQSCEVKRDVRALDKPSDHAPVVGVFKLIEE